MGESTKIRATLEHLQAWVVQCGRCGIPTQVPFGQPTDLPFTCSCGRSEMWKGILRRHREGGGDERAAPNPKAIRKSRCRALTMRLAAECRFDDGLRLNEEQVDDILWHLSRACANEEGLFLTFIRYWLTPALDGKDRVRRS